MSPTVFPAASANHRDIPTIGKPESVVEPNYSRRCGTISPGLSALGERKRRARSFPLNPLSITRISPRPKPRRSTGGGQSSSRLLLKYQWGPKRAWCDSPCEVLVSSVWVMLALSPQDVFCLRLRPGLLQPQLAQSTGDCPQTSPT